MKKYAILANNIVIDIVQCDKLTFEQNKNGLLLGVSNSELIEVNEDSYIDLGYTKQRQEALKYIQEC